MLLGLFEIYITSALVWYLKRGSGLHLQKNAEGKTCLASALPFRLCAQSGQKEETANSPLESWKVFKRKWSLKIRIYKTSSKENTAGRINSSRRNRTYRGTKA